jgi:hypothetical protein
MRARLSKARRGILIVILSSVRMEPAIYASFAGTQDDKRDPFEHRSEDARWLSDVPWP